jgi:hypothetical protein
MAGSSQPLIPNPVLQDWLCQRFEVVFGPEFKLHYEATLYGPMNAYLNTIFPLSREFLIKSQGHLLPGTDKEMVNDQEEEQEVATLYLPVAETPQPSVSDLAKGLHNDH